MLHTQADRKTVKGIYIRNTERKKERERERERFSGGCFCFLKRERDLVVGASVFFFQERDREIYMNRE